MDQAAVEYFFSSCLKKTSDRTLSANIHAVSVSCKLTGYIIIFNKIPIDNLKVITIKREMHAHSKPILDAGSPRCWWSAEVRRKSNRARSADASETERTMVAGKTKRKRLRT